MPFACPLCGSTSNRKGQPFDDPQNVVFHIDSKRDDVHRGESGAVLRDEIEHVDELPAPDPDASTSPAADGGATVEPAAEDTQPDDEPDGPEVLELTPHELGEMLEEAEETAYQAGRTDGEQAADDIEPETHEEPASGTHSQTDESSGLGTCPECGSDMMHGETFHAFIEARSEDDKAYRKWCRKNQGKEFSKVCSEPFECGYHVRSDGTADRFNQLGGGWAMYGLAGAAAAGLAALAAAADTDGGGDGPRVI